MSASPLLLVSSIPPVLRGQPFDQSGHIGFQRHVLNSWRQTGAKLLSLHTTFELAAHPDHVEQLHDAGVTVIAVTQADADPLPNLRAILTALIKAHPHAIISITNADILFATSSALPLALHDLQPHQALVGRRNNVELSPNGEINSCGLEDIYGFDFFAFHAHSISRFLPLIPENLVFGRPWWDLFLPMALLASGIELRDPGKNIFLHPIHQERWSGEQWLRFGEQADDRFRQLLVQQGCHGFASRWRRERRRAIFRWPGFTVLRHRFREQRRALFHERRLLPLYLSDVSEAINGLVNVELIPTAA